MHLGLIVGKTTLTSLRAEPQDVKLAHLGLLEDLGPLTPVDGGGCLAAFSAPLPPRHGGMCLAGEGLTLGLA